MSQVKQGDTVKVHYTGKFKDGTVFESSFDREPLKFIVGKNQVIAGFEKAIVGMSEGETKTFDVPPSDGYGEYRKELVATVERAKLQQEIKPELGLRLQISQGDKSPPAIVTVTSFTETHITLDANPPLAGKDLVFEIKLVEIV